MSKKTIRWVVLAVGAMMLASCSTNEIMRVAMNRDPGAAVKAMAQNRVNQYKNDPELLIQDIKRAQAEYNLLVEKLQQKSGQQWGKKESAELPTKTRYVKYTENYQNRVIVDFDAGKMSIEDLDSEGVQTKMKNAVVTALMTPEDPRSVDLFSDKSIDLGGRPYLQGLIADQNSKVINTREDAQRYAEYLVSRKLQSRKITVNGESKVVRFVQLSMVNNHLEKKAERFAEAVHKYSDETAVSRSLIFAVMKTESGFNPFAVSGAPAYGLMQLVPISGGRDAYRKVKGVDEAPTKDYLFVAENNIQLGSTYLGVLMTDSPLKGITDPTSREYCAIAAYNTGPGNVFKAFSSKTGQARNAEAIEKINALKPDEVYARLRSSLPYEETRGYVQKVVAAKKLYASL